MSIKGIVCLILLACVVAYPIGFYFMIQAPADSTFNKTFGSHATMAYDQATFESMLDQVNIVWKSMNDTFGTVNLDQVYCTWWYPDQNYDNSLGAQRDYFASITAYLRGLIKEKDQILAGNKTIIVPYYQWYQQSLDASRAEMKREGGLLWAITGAWYMRFASMIYFWQLYFLGPEIFLLALFAIALMFFFSY